MPTLGSVVCMWLEQALKNASPQKRRQIINAAAPYGWEDDIEAVGTAWYHKELNQLDRYKHPLIKVLINCAGDDDWDDNDIESYCDIINRYTHR